MMKHTTKVKKRTMSQFFISIGESNGKPTILNVNHIESIEQDMDCPNRLSCYRI